MRIGTIGAIALATWALAARAEAPSGDPVRGKALYMKNMCYTCHGTAGQGGDRGSGPRIAPNPFPWEAFAAQVRRPRESMPRYAPEYLSDAELASIYAYVASFKQGRKASEIPLLKE